VRGTLDSLGIYPDFVTAGAEKDTPEVYTRSGASELMRRNMNRVVTDLNDQINEDLSTGRKLGRAAVDELSDRGFLTGNQAREAGVVDGVLHADGVSRRLEDLLGEGVEEVPLRRYAGQMGPGWLESRKIIALVHVGGVLVPGDSVENAWYGRSTGAATLTATLKELGENQDVSAVVLRLDTPGGSSEASEMIWREIRRITESKPVVVSMGDYAASGGYYIAVAADEILAEPATITGSIGVFAGKFALAGLYDLMGMNWEQARSGRNDDMFHDRLPWTDEQRELIREQLTQVHARFQEVIVTGRNLSTEQVAELSTGRVYTGREALAHGLVDGLGGLPQAVLAAGRRAGLEDDAQVEVRIFPRGRGLLAGLTGAGTQATAPLPGPLGSLATDVALWELLAQERIAAFSPYRVVTP
jgi:protease-4